MRLPRTKTFGNRTGFTLIELLVVILILSILMAVALPLYLSAVADSSKKVCRGNMHTIANAVQADRVRNIFTDYSVIIAHNSATLDINPANYATGSLPDLGAVPLCPTGGQYTVQNGSTNDPTTFKVRCSLAAHGTFEPGVDSN